MDFNCFSFDVFGFVYMWFVDVRIGAINEAFVPIHISMADIVSARTDSPATTVRSAIVLWPSTPTKLAYSPIGVRFVWKRVTWAER